MCKNHESSLNPSPAHRTQKQLRALRVGRGSLSVAPKLSLRCGLPLRLLEMELVRGLAKAWRSVQLRPLALPSMTPQVLQFLKQLREARSRLYLS